MFLHVVTRGYTWFYPIYLDQITGYGSITIIEPVMVTSFYLTFLDVAELQEFQFGLQFHNSKIRSRERSHQLEMPSRKAYLHCKPIFITGNPCSHCRVPVFITGISL